MLYPEMVKTNARYRGPMESKKQTDAVLDIENTIRRLYAEFNQRKQSTTNLLTELTQEYHHTSIQRQDRIEHQILSVKGGEI